MTELRRYQTDIHESLAAGLEKNYKEQAKAYTDFQIQLVKSLRLRSESNQERLKNEVNLVLSPCGLERLIWKLTSAGLQQPRPPGQHGNEVHRALDHGFPPSHLHFRMH